MREIGGYLELDNYSLPMLHEGALALNCGRNCFAYLIEAKKIRKILMPIFLCESVIEVATKYNVKIRYYNIDLSFEPIGKIELEEDEWLYLVNYYSQFDEEYYSSMISQYKRVIVDQTQSYFDKPISGANSIYTCRKYFGVADGAFLYTDSELGREIEQDVSYNRMQFVLGRYERSAGDFYEEASKNNDFFDTEPIKKMSKLTLNLLHGINYEAVRKTRKENFDFLHDKLGKVNILNLKRESSFMYPLFVHDGKRIRKELQRNKIFIPELWPEIEEKCDVDTEEFDLATNLLPLPIDQRYTKKEMDEIVNQIHLIMR